MSADWGDQDIVIELAIMRAHDIHFKAFKEAHRDLRQWHQDHSVDSDEQPPQQLVDRANDAFRKMDALLDRSEQLFRARVDKLALEGHLDVLQVYEGEEPEKQDEDLDGAQVLTVRRIDDGPVLDNGHLPDCPAAWPEDAVMALRPGPAPQPCPGDHDDDDEEDEDEGGDQDQNRLELTEEEADNLYAADNLRWFNSDYVALFPSRAAMVADMDQLLIRFKNDDDELGEDR
jgi:hypothetical protein